MFVDLLRSVQSFFSRIVQVWSQTLLCDFMFVLSVSVEDFSKDQFKTQDRFSRKIKHYSACTEIN